MINESLLLYLLSELDWRCGAISGYLPDRAHDVGHGVDRHSGGEPTSQPQSHFLNYICEAVFKCNIGLFYVLQGGLINFEKHRRVGVCFSWIYNVCLYFSYVLIPEMFFFFLFRQEFEILSQIRQLQASCSQYSIPVNPLITSWVQAHMLLTDQERWDTPLQFTEKTFHLKMKSFFILFYQSFKAMSSLVTWSLQLIHVPVLPTLGAVASSIEKNLSCKSCKHLSFDTFDYP